MTCFCFRLFVTSHILSVESLEQVRKMDLSVGCQAPALISAVCPLNRMSHQLVCYEREGALGILHISQIDVTFVELHPGRCQLRVSVMVKKRILTRLHHYG